MRQVLLLMLAGGLLGAGLLPQEARAVTDEEVVRAIEKATEHLINLQQGDGTWPEQQHHAATAAYGHSEMALFTLAYIGVHPNREVISKGLNAVMSRALDYTYAISMRTMALATIQNKLASPKRELIRAALKNDVMWLVMAQGSHGGWDYKTLSGSNGRYDLSNTQMAILALREAALAGIEIPDIVWKRTQDLYFKLQQKDGSWNYGEHNDNLGKNTPGYGSMTAAGLATLFITSDNLEPGRGCPCRGGVSSIARGDLDRRIDAALDWHEKNFKPDGNPKAPEGTGWHHHYWLYSVERVGIAAGYKYFGARNWYKEGAEWLVKAQGGEGAWGGIPNTCFSTLFLYKGRAPILYNKLQHKGQWNNHRRDIANLTGFIERTKETPFHWQIVGLQAPVEELHDAPVLFITAETAPDFTPDEKKKLREFTDTGGTILFEASCGNPAVRKWFMDFAKEVWPEWPVKPLGPDHGSFVNPYDLKQRPEILGCFDGVRTFLFYAMDDISCPWNTKAYAGKDYLFKWGINLFSYATDLSPLRAKLVARGPAKTDRFTSPVKAGPKPSLRIARVKYDGPWITGRNYPSFRLLAEALGKSGIRVRAEEDGVAPADLADRDVAYLVGSEGELKITDAERQALKDYIGRGGFLWVESANGLPTVEQEFRKVASQAGWELKLLDKGHPILSGKFASAVGYDISQGVLFSRALRVARLGRTYAELIGIYQQGKLIGVLSPFDVTYSLTGYDAFNRRGYPPEDARAIATNILLYVTDRPAS